MLTFRHQREQLFIGRRYASRTEPRRNPGTQQITTVIRVGASGLHLYSQVKLLLLCMQQETSYPGRDRLLLRQSRPSRKGKEAVEIVRESFHEIFFPRQAKQRDVCMRVSLSDSTYGRDHAKQIA